MTLKLVSLAADLGTAQQDANVIKGLFFLIGLAIIVVIVFGGGSKK